MSNEAPTPVAIDDTKLTIDSGRRVITKTRSAEKRLSPSRPPSSMGRSRCGSASMAESPLGDKLPKRKTSSTEGGLRLPKRTSVVPKLSLVPTIVVTPPHSPSNEEGSSSGGERSVRGYTWYRDGILNHRLADAPPDTVCFLCMTQPTVRRCVVISGMRISCSGRYYPIYRQISVCMEVECLCPMAETNDVHGYKSVYLTSATVMHNYCPISPIDVDKDL